MRKKSCDASKSRQDRMTFTRFICNTRSVSATNAESLGVRIHEFRERVELIDEDCDWVFSRKPVVSATSGSGS